MLRDSEGRGATYPFALWAGESLFTQIADPQRFPARTPVLAADGRDLASALRTIVEIGDASGLHAAVDRAFPGCCRLLDGATVAMDTPGLCRPLAAHELSDGTVRYLYLLAVLLTPARPGCWPSTNPRPACTPTCSNRWPSWWPPSLTAARCG